MNIRKSHSFVIEGFKMVSEVALYNIIQRRV